VVLGVKVEFRPAHHLSKQGRNDYLFIERTKNLSHKLDNMPSAQPSTPPTTPPGPEPSLPLPSPSLSYWHKTTRGFPHLNANKNTPTPESAEYIIIGSGISGALTAFSLISSGISGNKIVILEAREAVSGASGRNAGHVRPDAFRGYAAYAAVHGPEQAKKIIVEERKVLHAVDEFVQRYDVPCDFNLTTTFDVCLTAEFAEYEAKSFEAYKAAGGDVSHVRFHEGDEAKRRTRVPEAVAAYEWPAGSSHPAKLAQWLLSSVIDKGAQFWTHCPVIAVTESKRPGYRWDVRTPRGTIATQKVVHSTNAYAAALLPHLNGYITPNRAQAHSLVPNSAFSAENAFNSTMSLRYSLHHFYSIIQRKGDGTIILGVSRSNPELSAETLAVRESFDDGAFNQEIVDDALKRFGIMFPEDSAESERHGEGLDHAWTGIIAMTPDSVPYVGAIEELPGQYICAGFNGHG
jgi:glycine/D-amino acid oxidase-like deaminating enzyme